MMAALKRMRSRGRGKIVNVGSALACRSVPLQSAYCGAKAAIRGFTNSLRSELIHDGLDIQLTMVHLPVVNKPQFDWALNKMKGKHSNRNAPPLHALGGTKNPPPGLQPAAGLCTHVTLTALAELNQTLTVE